MEGEQEAGGMQATKEWRGRKEGSGIAAKIGKIMKKKNIMRIGVRVKVEVLVVVVVMVTLGNGGG